MPWPIQRHAQREDDCACAHAPARHRSSGFEINRTVTGGRSQSTEIELAGVIKAI